jgi:uncharacterized OsmC-like protein
MKQSSTTSSPAKHFVDNPVIVVAHARAITAAELRLEESSCAVKVNVGTSHSFIVDLPHKNLGNVQVDLGCSPKEMLMSAVAASTAMSVRSAYVHHLYEEGRLLEGLAAHDDQLPSPDSKWRHSKLDNVTVTVHEIMKNDMYIPEEIHLGVSLRGQLTAQQEKLLLQAADACPMRKMLTGVLPRPVKVSTAH